MKNFKINDFFFLTILIILSIFFIKLFAMFLMDIFLAIVLYIIFKKPFTYVLTKTKNRQRASLVTVTIIFLVVFIPLFFIGMMVSIEAAENYSSIKEQVPKLQEMLTTDKLQEYALKIPLAGEMISEQFEGMDVEQIKKTGTDLFMSAGSFIIKMLQAAFLNIASFLMHLFIIPFILFYLFLDSDKLMKKIRNVMPFEKEDETRAAKELVKITETIIIYTFLIGVAEGTYGGLLFFFMDIGSPFFWGVLMVVLSMIPILGANTIIVPAALIQIFQGNYAIATTLLIIGAGLIVINQNIIKPKLAGDRSGLHPVIMFISSIGGIAWLGMIGFLVGPLIAALTIVSWDLFAIKFKNDKPIKADAV